MKKLILISIVFCFILSSCAQNSTSGNQAIGTGAGVAIGALIGQAIGGNTLGTLLGAAAGGLAGYAIGTQVSIETKQVYNQQDTKKLYANSAKQDTVVKVHEESIEPTKTFKAGDNVTARVTYILIDSKHSKVPVHEKKTLWYNGKQEAVFEDTVIQRENGTWESLITFQLPEDAQKGTYLIRQDISIDSDKTKDSSSLQFSVI